MHTKWPPIAALALLGGLCLFLSLLHSPWPVWDAQDYLISEDVAWITLSYHSVNKTDVLTLAFRRVGSCQKGGLLFLGVVVYAHRQART